MVGKYILGISKHKPANESQVPITAIMTTIRTFQQNALGMIFGEG